MNCPTTNKRVRSREIYRTFGGGLAADRTADGVFSEG